MADEEIRARHQGGNNRKWTGLVLLLVGSFLLAQRLGMNLDDRLFNWQTLMIVIGIGVGIKNGFRGSGWLILIMIGSFFLINDYYPEMSIHAYLWPIMVIGVGLIFIFRPHHDNRWHKNSGWSYWKNKKQEWEQQYQQNIPVGDDYVDITSILSGTKRSVLSKNFRGGEVISIFGGTELDLSQADINGRVEMELTQIFGGTKLIVPPHWDVRAELVSLFAGVEDRRPPVNNVVDPNKVLVLKGASVFGGIDIRSY